MVQLLAGLSGHNDIVMGDARISLENEAERGQFQDLMYVLDAFSSDSIPVHL